MALQEPNVNYRGEKRYARIVDIGTNQPITVRIYRDAAERQYEKDGLVRGEYSAPYYCDFQFTNNPDYDGTEGATFNDIIYKAQYEALKSQEIIDENGNVTRPFDNWVDV